MPIPLIENSNLTYIDPDNDKDPYWDTEIYNQHVLDDIELYQRSTDENLPIPNIRKTTELFENWQMNDGTSHSVSHNPLETEHKESTTDTSLQSLLD